MNKRLEIGQYFIDIIIIIWFGGEVLINTTMENIYVWSVKDINKFLAYLVLVLLIIQILFFQDYNMREVFLIITISVIITIVTLSQDRKEMMSLWLFVVASKYINFDKVVLSTNVVLISLSVVVFYLYFSGQIGENILYRGGQIRHSWGFIHPNWLGVRCFQFVVAHFYIRRNRINLFDYILLAFSIWFVYRIPNCQTAYIALGTFGIMLVVKKVSFLIEGGKELFCKAVIGISAIANAASIFLSYVDVRKIYILNMLDRFMSKRFSWCHKVLEYYGINLFGQRIQLYDTRFRIRFHRFYLDSAYPALLIRYGLVVYLFFSILFLYTMYRDYKNKQYMLVLILGLYSIYGIMENSLFVMSQNIFLLAISSAFYNMPNTTAPEKISKTRVRIII